MLEIVYSEVLADLSRSNAPIRAGITLACVWLFVDLLRKAPWASTGFKAILCVSAASTGLLFYPSIARHLAGDARSLAYGWSAVFLIASALGLADTITGKTTLRLPERGWGLVFVLASVTAGIGFPLIETIAGRSAPAFQVFALAPAPFVLVALPLLACAGPRSQLHTAWLVTAFIAGADCAFFSFLSCYPYAHPLASVVLFLSGLLALRARQDRQRSSL